MTKLESTLTAKTHAHDEESLVNPNDHVLRFARGETSQIPPTQVGAELIQQQQHKITRRGFRKVTPS